MERNPRLFVEGCLGICALEKNMNSGHPTYPNPTITEAVCDIHFRLSQEKEWRPSFPGELFKHIQTEPSFLILTGSLSVRYRLAKKH